MQRHGRVGVDYGLRIGLAAALLAAAVWTGGCREQATPKAPPAASQPAGDTGPLSGEITVLVPCGQLGPFMDAKQIFIDKHPGVKLNQRVENINVLRTMILEDKLQEGDVFMDLGDTVARELLDAGKLIPGTEVAHAGNYISLIVPKGNPAGVRIFTDLGNPKVQVVALAEPTENSNGAYAAEALKKAGLWDKLQKAGKIVTTKQPAELKVMVGQKKADAAFIYGPCVHEVAKGETEPKDSLPKKTELVGNVPEDLYTPFYCTAGVLSRTDNEPLARAFAAFLDTDEASEIWQKWYFGPRKANAGQRAQALLVHCGAGIRPPMDEIAALFEERTGTNVDLAYKGSGCLLADIEFSRKGDLYMPGESEYMDQAKAKDFIVEAVPVATMETVIITPLGDETVKSLADLGKSGLKVGLGAAPQTAAGVAAKAVLEKAGSWEAVESNVTMNALNVVELANSVKLEGLDAAIVWDATAHLVKGEVRVVPIDRKYAYKTQIPLGTLKFSRHPDQAQLFMELVESAEGQDIFKKHGYGPIAVRHA
ncbi:MAG: molybdate ABC transporter substrate-binding protein [Armatimonadetes bacterium]|nr:molybdate ABC transporter substrate-binding protein [Armatimonadota bacterium]